MNTERKGQVSIMVLQNSRSNKFLGICYELAIVLENDNEIKLKEDMINACKGYVDAVRSSKLSDRLLNKPEMLPIEYKVLFEEFEKRIIEKKVTKKLSKEYENAFQTGRANLSMACV